MARSNFSVAVLAGAVGAAVGLLMAPKSGRETRDDIKQRLQTTRQRAMDQGDKFRAVVDDNKGDISDSLRRSAKEMIYLGEEAKIRASRIAHDARKTSTKVQSNVRRRFSEDDELSEEP